MQLKTLLTLGFASMTVAAPIVAGTLNTFDLPAITDTFNAIQGGIDKMVTDVKAFTGDPQQLVAIQEDNDAILKIINDGTDKVSKSTAMGIMDALGILGPTGTLASKVDEVIAALADKKKLLSDLNLQSIVVKDLTDQRSASDNLIKAIVANLPMPSVLGMIANPIAKQITDKLDAGVKTWQK
jgi:hypothetical protein